MQMIRQHHPSVNFKWMLFFNLPHRMAQQVNMAR